MPLPFQRNTPEREAIKAAIREPSNQNIDYLMRILRIDVDEKEARKAIMDAIAEAQDLQEAIFTHIGRKIYPFYDLR